MPTEPYVPNTPPSSGDLPEMARFLEDELGRIAHGIRTTTVQAAFGGLAIVTPRTGVLGVTPQYIQAWDTFYPPRPSRIITNDAPLGGADPMTVLQVLESGVYYVHSQVNTFASTGSVINMTLRRNEEETDVYGTWDLSNQSAQLWMNFAAIVEAKAGDVFSVWASAGGTISFDIQAATFELFRVSELLNVVRTGP
jgi:hypothetical protein